MDIFECGLKAASLGDNGSTKAQIAGILARKFAEHGHSREAEHFCNELREMLQSDLPNADKIRMSADLAMALVFCGDSKNAVSLLERAIDRETRSEKEMARVANLVLIAEVYDAAGFQEKTDALAASIHDATFKGAFLCTLIGESALKGRVTRAFELASLMPVGDGRLKMVVQVLLACLQHNVDSAERDVVMQAISNELDERC